MSVYLVCGSRDWPQDKLWFVTAKMIELIPQDATVLTGGARGVDHHAHFEAVRLRRQTQVIKADWDAYGKRAGYLRNIAMLDIGPAAVLAFHWGRSKGTAHTIREAYKRSIPVHRFVEYDLRPDIGALDADYEPISLAGVGPADVLYPSRKPRR